MLKEQPLPYVMSFAAKLLAFLTLVLMETTDRFHTRSDFTPRERARGTSWIGGSV